MCKRWVSGLLAVVVISVVAAPAAAQDAPDLGQVAKFVRWGGVFLSIFVVLGTSLVLRIVHGAAGGLGRRFSSHRLLVQKLESIAQFIIYVLASSAVLGLSVRLDSTALTVIGGGLALFGRLCHARPGGCVHRGNHHHVRQAVPGR